MPVPHTDMARLPKRRSSASAPNSRVAPSDTTTAPLSASPSALAARQRRYPPSTRIDPLYPASDLPMMKRPSPRLTTSSPEAMIALASSSVNVRSTPAATVTSRAEAPHAAMQANATDSASRPQSERSIPPLNARLSIFVHLPLTASPPFPQKKTLTYDIWFSFCVNTKFLPIRKWCLRSLGNIPTAVFRCNCKTFAIR